jgi:hypothetical protein
MPHRLTVLLFATALLTLPGCYSCEQADITRYLTREGFPLATEPPPAQAESLGLVHAEETGFYLVGYFPLVRASLQGCLDRLLRSARALGADGVADLRYEVSPARLFKFSVFPVPDWSARVFVTGTAYRRRDPGPDPGLRVGAPWDPGAIDTAPAPTKGR